MIRSRITLMLSAWILLIISMGGCNSKRNADEITSEISGVIPTRVVSFNIRYNNPADGINSWNHRKEDLARYLRIENPDLIGMQEVLYDQLQYIENHLSEYTRTGVGRDDGALSGEFTPVFYRTSRYALLDSGNFWLSPTPSVPSKGWDAVLNRICTYVVLKDRINNDTIHFFNTHFSHVGTEARRESAELIMDSIQSISKKRRVLLTGDLNTLPGSDPYLVLTTQGMMDARECELHLGPEGTYNGFHTEGPFDRRIDYVFYRGFIPVSYLVNSLLIDQRFLSDHFPVVVNLE